MPSKRFVGARLGKGEVGSEVGVIDGNELGARVGNVVGGFVGLMLGTSVGIGVGNSVGRGEGTMIGNEERVSLGVVIGTLGFDGLLSSSTLGAGSEGDG